MNPVKLLFALMLAAAALLTGGYLIFQKSGFEVLPITTIGDVGLFRFLRHHGEIEVEVRHEGKASPAYSRHMAIDPGWTIGLAMLPGRGIGGDDLDSPFSSHPVFLGWLDDGTPIIGHRLNATSVVFPGDIGFGSNSVEAGDSAWQLVCIRDTTKSALLIRIASDATPVQLAAAVAAVPSNARWSTLQIIASMQLLMGTKEEAFQVYVASPSLLRHANGQNEWSAYNTALNARAVALKPLMARWINACDPTTGTSMDYGSGSYSQSAGRWEFRQRTHAPGQGLRDETMDRLVWLHAAIDAGNSDAAALNRLKRAGSASVIADMMLRTQYTPSGSGLALAERWLADLPVPLPDTPETRNEFTRIDSVVNCMLRSSFVPSMKAEADAFLDEVARSGPDLLIDLTLSEFVLSTIFDVPSDQTPTPEAFVAAVEACRWDRARASIKRNAVNNPRLPGYFQQRLYLDGETLRVRPPPQ